MNENGSMEARLSRITSRVLKAQELDSWQARVEGVLDACYEELAAVAAGLYVLHLHTGTLELDWVRGRSSILEPSIDVTDTGHLTGLAQRAATTGKVQTHAPFVWLPVVRWDNVLFLLALVQPRPLRNWEDLQATLSPLIPAYVARRVGRTLENSRERLDFRAPWDKFMSALGEAVLTSSGYRYAALRELRKTRLHCLDAWGFPRNTDKRDLSFPVERYEPFQAAIQGRTTAVMDLRYSSASALAELPGLEDVRGFIAVPVYAGKDTFGVLSCATTVRYQGSAAELAALETLGNVVGLAITHYRNPSGPSPSLDSMSDFSIHTSLEVIAASARHEGLAGVDNAITYLSRIRKAKTQQQVENELEALQGVLLDLAIIIDKIQTVANPPEYTWRNESLRDLWQQAVDQFSGRIDSLDIRVHSPQADVTVACYPDWLRSVFVQLILNSVHAFSKKGFGLRQPPKEGREIGLVVHQSRPDQPIVLTYWDNATGINGVMVHTRSGDEHLPLGRKIFRPGATSKQREGTGWGLALARTVLAEHSGSITLQSNSVEGVSFRIELPTQKD